MKDNPLLSVSSCFKMTFLPLSSISRIYKMWNVYMKKQQQNEWLEFMSPITFGATGTGSYGEGQTIKVRIEYCAKLINQWIQSSCAARSSNVQPLHRQKMQCIWKHHSSMKACCQDGFFNQGTGKTTTTTVLSSNCISFQVTFILERPGKCWSNA